MELYCDKCGRKIEVTSGICPYCPNDSNTFYIDGGNIQDYHDFWGKIDPETQTFVNGKEFKEYDKFERFLKKLDERIATQENYAGYPNIPENCFDAFELYDGAPDEEKRFMFGLLYSYYKTALQHWKADVDKLWTEKGRKEHAETIEKYKDILPYMGKSKSMFPSI
jgi:hypothetical protein